jgi:glutaredoxin
MARTWWLPWTWQQPRRLSDVRVVVYTRQNCHLCEEAAAFLQREQDRLGFQLQWIDVDQNEELRALHGDWVPVVAVNGQVRFRGRINEVLWQRLMKGLQSN